MSPVRLRFTDPAEAEEIRWPPEDAGDPLDAGTIIATAGVEAVTIAEGTPPSGGVPPYTRDLYRSTTSGQTGSLVGSDIALPYVDEPLTAGVPVYHTVRVLDSRDESADTPQVSVTPEAEEDPEYNEPAGYTQLFHADCTHKNYGNMPSESRLVVVSDPRAPHGSAIEWRWPPGSGEGFPTHYNPPFGPVSGVYYRLIIAYNANWQHHPGGDKLMYFGHVGKASSYFPQLRDGGDWGSGRYRVGFQNQSPTGGTPSFFWVSQTEQGEEGIANTDGDYHVWEFQMVAQSSASASDGIFRMWYDGALKEERTNMRYVTSGDVRFQNCEWYPYWGGSGSPPKNREPYDWLRYGELYISGVA